MDKYYVVQVNGMNVSPIFPSQQLAESQISGLSISEQDKKTAVVVEVTQSGQRLLLG